MTQQASALFQKLNLSPEAMTAYQTARAAMNRQEYAIAIDLFTDMLAHMEMPDALRARLLEYRGECYWLLSEFEQAEADYQAAITSCSDRDQVARARVRLGEAVDFRGEYERSAQIYQQALQEGTAVNNLMVIGRARRGLGILNRRQGNTDQALNHLTQALAAFRQAGEAREQARVLTSLGRTRHVRGEYQLALSHHRDALKILESLNDRWRIVQSLNDIGECHQSLYDMPHALQYHQRALQLADEYGADLLKPEIQRNLGVDLLEHGRFTEGLVYLHQALDGTRALNNREQEALTLYHLARAYFQHEELTQAESLVHELNETAQILDTDRYHALAALAQGELNFLRGQQAEAVIELNKAMLAAQSTMDRGGLWKLH
ncbi:MAG: tetratricopeptide repeat protein, partial [Anaerolineales bacterium]|nr:tetratricopeptide repeat protein [Anaerolineales bacterium]